MLLRGSIRIFVFFDVGEAFDLEKLRTLVGPRAGPTKPDFPRRTPEYVRFENPPIEEPSEPLTLGSGEKVVCSIKYYEYAIVEVQLQVPFGGTWDDLMRQTARWMDAPDLEPECRAVVTRHLQRTSSAITRPRAEWLQENYLVIDLDQMKDEEGEMLTADQILNSFGEQIGQLLRGEEARLARSTNDRILQGSLSYYSTDLLVVGFNAALVYDRPEESARSIQILEYARMQLLEFRYYDNYMTRVLADVYNNLDHKTNVLLSRWALPREANRLNTIRLDVMELTERVDNAIKFLSDMFSARLYKLAAAKVGVPDYKDLVNEKLRTAEELYRFMVDEFHQSRAFILELMVVIILIIDLVYLFRGYKPI